MQGKRGKETERFTTVIFREQMDNLRILSESTRVGMADYTREALDMLFLKYGKEIEKAKKEKEVNERQKARAGLTKPRG